jgi:LysR family transcriptional regulator, glycine cleavage system transcriptional activator
MNWRDIPSLAALRAFEAAARHESFSAAARDLNVTHAAIAQHVRALEQEFDTALMDRQGRNMVPTAAGRRLARDLGAGFAEIAVGVRNVRQMRGDGPVSLTTTVSFAENWLMPRIARFWSDRPDIPVTISADNKMHDLRREGHDLAIRYGKGDWPGLEARLLTRADTVVVAHPSVAARLPEYYAATANTALQMLAKLPWVIDSSYGEFASWMTAKGLDQAGLTCTALDGSNLVLAAVRAGAGVAIHPHAVVERDLATGTLVSLLEEPDSGDLGYYIVTPKGAVPARTKAFLTWLMAQS